MRPKLGRKATRHANKHCNIVVKRKYADIVARKTRSPNADSQPYDITSMPHQSGTVTVKPRPAISDGNGVKDASVIGQLRRPIRSRKVPNDGSVKIKHEQVNCVDGRQPLKDAGKLHPNICTASADAVRVATDDKQEREPAKNAPRRVPTTGHLLQLQPRIGACYNQARQQQSECTTAQRLQCTVSNKNLVEHHRSASVKMMTGATPIAHKYQARITVVRATPNEKEAICSHRGQRNLARNRT